MAKVFLSAGHGGKDPGACANGLVEKDINLNIMLACAEVLKAHGVDVVCSRTRDEDDPVQQEVNEANASRAVLAVSFHTNAGGGHGFEGFYYPGDSKGKQLIELATEEVTAIGQESHGNPCKNGKRLRFVNGTNMTAVLFESFFLDSEDRAIGDTIEEQHAFGVAYAKAILKYLHIAYKLQARWIKDNTGWWYQNSNGTYPKNQWMSINWRWYYFDENGYMVTGWIQQNGKWYYCDSSGAMVIGERMIGNERFYFAEDGHMCVTNERGALV